MQAVGAERRAELPVWILRGGGGEGDSDSEGSQVLRAMVVAEQVTKKPWISMPACMLPGKHLAADASNARVGIALGYVLQGYRPSRKGKEIQCLVKGYKSGNVPELG